MKHKLKMNYDLQLRFLKRLSRLLQSGYPILSALEKLRWDKQLSTFANQIIISLKNGDTIDQAFENANFHPSVTSFMYFVRANNDLEGSINKSIEMFQQRLTNEKKFKQIIRYPIVLIFIFTLLLYSVKELVLPTFLDIFTEESNKTVYFSITIINLFTTFVTLTTIALIILCSSWIFIQRRIPTHKQVEIYKRIPIYKNYLLMQTSYFFATHFGSLLKTGMSYKEILGVMKNQQKLPFIAYYSSLIMQDLSRGVHFSYVVSQLELLDKQLTSIFQQDIEVNALEMDLSIYAELLMEDIEAKILKILTWLQPLFLIIIGGFIIFLYISLMWPMFQLIKTI